MVERGFSARAQKWSADFAKENKAGAEAYQEAEFREAYQEAESWYQVEFREKTKTELERAGITDQTFPLATGIQQQAENASEFNVDKISLQDLEKHVMEELSGEPWELELDTDAAATLGTCHKAGPVKMRHVQTKYL